MKSFAEYLFAAALALSALTIVAVDAHAATVCGPNGCHRVYQHRSQWPVGQPGKYYNSAPYACVMVGGQRTCR
jgi:hypothetical protein